MTRFRWSPVKRPLPYRLTQHRRLRDGESPIPPTRTPLLRRCLHYRVYANRGLGYLYAFDDDFDAAEDVYRLDTATNPYDPN